MKASLTVAGQSVMYTDSFVHHEFRFTPSSSFFVICDSGGEIRRMAQTLAEGGSELMPLNNFGCSTLFA